MKKRLYMFGLALIAVIFTSQIAPAINPTPQGFNRTLSIKGTDFNKQPYSGTLEVKSRKIKSPSADIEGVTLKWNVGGTPYQGIGIVTSQILTATWGGSSCSLVVYAVEGKKLTGLWTVSNSPNLGAEFATAVSTKGIVGSYNVTGTGLDGSSYKGSLDVIDHGPVYQFSWNVGSKYEGIGIRTKDLVSVAWGGSSKDTCGVVQYLITDNGLSSGKWGFYGQNATGTEEGTLR
jgi:hypothetical protein